MDRLFYVYVCHDGDGTPCYVGRSCDWGRCRVQAKRYGGNENHYLIYDRDLTLAQANRLESQLIRKFRRVMDGGTLWNLSLGGQGRSGRIRYPGGHSNSAESWAMSLPELHYFNLELNRLESHQRQQSRKPVPADA